MSSGVPALPDPATVLPDLAALVAALRAAGATVAGAESLTGGLVGATLTSVPGSSQVYRGGVISYATDLKVSLLGVPPSLVAAYGVVSAECAAAMARGVRSLTGSTYGLSTTGVAGPGAQAGVAAGTAYVGVCGPSGIRTQALSLAGDRETVRRGCVAAVLSALSEQAAEDRRGRVGEEPVLG